MTDLETAIAEVKRVTAELDRFEAALSDIKEAGE